MAATVSFRNEKGWIDKRGIFDVIFDYALKYLDQSKAPMAVSDITNEHYMLSFFRLPLSEQRALLEATERGLAEFIARGPGNPDLMRDDVFPWVSRSGAELVAQMKASIAAEEADPTPGLPR